MRSIMKFGVSCADEHYFTTIKQFARDIERLAQLTNIATDAAEVEVILRIRDELIRQRVRYTEQNQQQRSVSMRIRKPGLPL